MTIPILDPGVLENSKTFNFALSNPVSTISANCYLVAPSNAVITITNTVTQVSFSSAAYSTSETNAQALITVLRAGVTNTTASVQYATADGTGHAGTNYFAADGTLTFEPGVTSMTFAVNIIDDHVITANHTVLLSLSQPQGGVILGSPSNAVLTLLEANGAYIVPAGTYLTSASTSGVIQPGQTVTMDFALRCVAGGNTTNLVATLQTNSGVTPGVPTNYYGELVQGGPVVFEPFTFTANGTNNQTINLVFQLQDGSRNLSNAVFSFILGLTTTTFSNTGLISLPTCLTMETTRRPPRLTHPPSTSRSDRAPPWDRPPSRSAI